MKLRNYLLISIVLCSLSVIQTAKADASGVLGIFKLNDNSNYLKIINKLEYQVEKLNCTLRREGEILGMQGEYDLEPINHFFLLECESKVLTKKLDEIWISQLNKNTTNLSLLEGAFLTLDKKSMGSSGIKRAYILKLSKYRKLISKQRISDLSEIDELVKSREHKYTTEAYFQINDHFGVEQPDEVVVIHYDSQEAGNLFRSRNEDILTKIGEFNKEHLVQFKYLIAISNR